MDLFFPVPDWENDKHYATVGELDRAGLAWEFVRRDPQYRDIVAADDEHDMRDHIGATILPDQPPPLDRWGLSFR